MKALVTGTLDKNLRAEIFFVSIFESNLTTEKNVI